MNTINFFNINAIINTANEVKIEATRVNYLGAPVQCRLAVDGQSFIVKSPAFTQKVMELVKSWKPAVQKQGVYLMCSQGVNASAIIDLLPDANDTAWVCHPGINNDLYRTLKQMGYNLVYRPITWSTKKAGFERNDSVIEWLAKPNTHLVLGWNGGHEGNDFLIKDLYRKACKSQRGNWDIVLNSEDDELVDCSEVLESLYIQRARAYDEHDEWLKEAIEFNIRRLASGWEQPWVLKEVERDLADKDIWLDIGWNTGWSIDDSEAGGHLVEETAYDGFGFDNPEAY